MKISMVVYFVLKGLKFIPVFLSTSGLFPSQNRESCHIFWSQWPFPQLKISLDRCYFVRYFNEEVFLCNFMFTSCVETCHCKTWSHTPSCDHEAEGEYFRFTSKNDSNLISSHTCVHASDHDSTNFRITGSHLRAQIPYRSRNPQIYRDSFHLI